MGHIRKVLLIIGVISMLSSYGCFGKIKYSKYASKDPALNITLDYISDWLFKESRGAYGSYAQVIFYEPPRKDKHLKAGIIITVEDSSKVKLASLDIGSFFEALLKKRKTFKDLQVISKSSRKTLKAESIDLEISYKTLDRINDIDALIIPVKEKIVVLKLRNNFYTIRYQNTEEEFDSFAKAFDHVLKSLKLKEPVKGI